MAGQVVLTTEAADFESVGCVGPDSDVSKPHSVEHLRGRTSGYQLMSLSLPRNKPKSPLDWPRAGPTWKAC